MHTNHQYINLNFLDLTFFLKVLEEVEMTVNLLYGRVDQFLSGHELQVYTNWFTPAAEIWRQATKFIIHYSKCKFNQQHIYLTVGINFLTS